MKNLLSNKTLQATYGGDVIGGSVVRGMLGASLFFKEVIYKNGFVRCPYSNDLKKGIVG